MNLLETSVLNKGTAFTDAERAASGLEGLLPPSVQTIDQQYRLILQFKRDPFLLRGDV